MFSDHKPLQFLFCETRPVPPMASARIQRWALTLSAYNYQIVYWPSQLQANADGLSRLPLKGEEPGVVPLPGDTILMMESLSNADSVVTAPLSGIGQIRTQSCLLSDEWSCMVGSHRQVMSLDHTSNVSLNLVSRMDVYFEAVG